MSQGISRVGVDSAGGLIAQALAPTVYVNSKNVTCKGAQVIPHGIGIHASAVMVGASSTVYAGGIQISREGDAASCGHVSTGSTNVFAG